MKINPGNYKVSYLDEHWGQVKGGKLRHRKKFRSYIKIKLSYII